MGRQEAAACRSAWFSSFAGGLLRPCGEEEKEVKDEEGGDERKEKDVRSLEKKNCLRKRKRTVNLPQMQI